MKSLFGDEIPDVPVRRCGRRREDRAHAAPIGTGPAGKQCKDCRHYSRGSRARYKKCWLMRELWTSGPGTDIRAKDAACRYFEDRDNL